MSLLDEQRDALAARFRHFDADSAAELFHPDQTGRAKFKDQPHPAVTMRNGVQWFYDRTNRPAKLKAMAPPGSSSRPPLTDDPRMAEPWHVVVEGEGDAVALASVGHRGIFCTGGTDYAAQQAKLFAGRRVWLLFDSDDAGARGARAFALAATNAGAEQVHVAKLPEGTDPEEWLGTFETRDAALAALHKVLGDAEQVGRDDLLAAQEEADARDGFETEKVMNAVDGENLIVTIWEPGWDEPQLAVYGPSDFGAAADEPAPSPYPGREPPQQSEQSSVVRGWRVLDALRVADQKRVYRPRVDDGMDELVKLGTVMVPPTPAEAVDHGELWDRVRAFFERWLAAADDDYDVLTAYTFVGWRLEDAGFGKVPFLRIWGASSSGKTRTVELMHMVSCYGLYASLTSSNLHRVVQSLGSFTLLWDEFNPENMSRDGARDLVNMLNLSQTRISRAIRMVPGGKGEDMKIGTFKLFGPKVFCGYLPTEDDGFRRRTIEINMSRVSHVPDSKRFATLPREAEEEARECRAGLLAWRAEQLARGLVDAAGDATHDELVGRGVHAMLDTFWPLLYVAPPDRPEVRAALMERAERAERSFKRSRYVKAEAYVLEALAEMLRSGTFFMTSERAPVVTMTSLVEATDEHQRMDLQRMTSVLREMDISISRPRVYARGDGASYIGRRSGVVVDDNNIGRIEAACKMHGVPIDPEAIEAHMGNEGGL